MIDFNAHSDGEVIVPEQAVDLPRNRSFIVPERREPGGGIHAGIGTSVAR
jgi:hypothetical protein